MRTHQQDEILGEAVVLLVKLIDILSQARPTKTARRCLAAATAALALLDDLRSQ